MIRLLLSDAVFVLAFAVLSIAGVVAAAVWA